MKYTFFIIITLILLNQKIEAKEYYVHPIQGKDTNDGNSKINSFKTLKKLSELQFHAGDKIILANGLTYSGSFILQNQKGTSKKPIEITSHQWENTDSVSPAIINFKNHANGVLLEDCSFIKVSNLQLTGNGYIDEDTSLKMRCGILVLNKTSKIVKDIFIQNISIYDVFYENIGFIRGKEEVKSANGTQKYGWGIRVVSPNPKLKIKNVTIENCKVNNVSHTGIQLTGSSKNISKITIIENSVEKTGGPGIQMSGVENVYVTKNKVSHSGSNDDSRKWGRGSGLWTWGSSNVLIEKNQFLYANGPGDSAGAHIDYNCDNIVLQYNLSAYNAGGFCEILGNNYNCMYRYNISINDGHRVKGVNGAFQEGKVFWLSGYQGNKEPKGPVNSYFYNNTIYSDESIEAKFAIDNTSNGIVIANNIFCIKGVSKVVMGDQNKRDAQKGLKVENVTFRNNLFLNENTWPKELKMEDTSPLFGNPKFMNNGELKLTDYIPQNILLTTNKGIKIPRLKKCKIKLLFDLYLENDILNNELKGVPCIGAICQ
ncbi:MAG: right-handed parallel beta-helix repeat-containing protein [Chitinophagaceae bacterium]|nr:right-handed parallel beta-helix repeat-containing protein [Chitinophagaceae bacterium]